MRNQSFGKTQDEKGFAAILFLPIVLFGIVVTVYLALNPTFFKPKATEEAITFKNPAGTPLPQDSAGVDVTTSRTIKIVLSAPTAPSPSPQAFKLVKEAFAQTCPSTHIRYSCSDVRCPNGNIAPGFGCHSSSDARYTNECLANCARPTPTPTPTPRATASPSPIGCTWSGTNWVGVCPHLDPSSGMTPPPIPTPTPQVITADSYVLTDSPANPQNPAATDPNVLTGTLSSNTTTINSYTLTRTDPGESFIFVKFTYSNGQTRVVSKRLKYDPNFGASPTPSISASSSPSPSPVTVVASPPPAAARGAQASPGATHAPLSSLLVTPDSGAQNSPSPTPAVVPPTQSFTQAPLLPTNPLSKILTQDSDVKTNLLVNGDFEQNLTAPSVATTGVLCTPAGEKGECVRDYLIKKNGDYSIKVEFKGGGFGNQLEWPKVQASLGEELCLSYWVKRSTLFTALVDKPMVAIQSQGADENSFYQALYPDAITTDWQFVQGTITVGKDWVTPIRVFLRSRFRFGDSNWFDSVSLEKGACG